MPSRKNAQTAAPAPPPEQSGLALVLNSALIELYAAMLRCRLLNQRARDLSKPSRLRTPLGWEAVAAAVSLDLWSEDSVAPPAGDLAVSFLRGIPLEALLLPFCRPVAKGPDRGPAETYAARNVLAPWWRAGARTSVAAGVALAYKRSNDGKIAVAFRDPSGREAHWNEMLDFAAAQALPMIFVSHGSSRAATAAVRPRARDGGKRLQVNTCQLPVVPVDRDDAVALYRVAHEAIAHARRGSGPTLIECTPFLLPGQATGTRRPSGDAILNMESYLTLKGLYADKLRAEVAARFQRELDAATQAARRGGRADGRRR